MVATLAFDPGPLLFTPGERSTAAWKVRATGSLSSVAAVNVVETFCVCEIVS